MNEETPTLNIKLLLECWDWVKFRNGTDGLPFWYQGAWVDPEYVTEDPQTNQEVCGTACCIAGYAVISTGNAYQFKDKVLGLSEYVVKDYINTGDDEVSSDPKELPGLRLLADRWARAGQILLGLTDREAEDLFSPCNSETTIRNAMNRILESRGESIRVG